MSTTVAALESVVIVGTEKRRDSTGKFYVYHIIVHDSGGRVAHVWRRYSQFDALFVTMVDILGPGVQLPKLTGKKFLGRSSVQSVADRRRPKLQMFLTKLLTFSDNVLLTRTLAFFLTPTAEDEAHAAQRPEGPDHNASDSDDSDDDDGHTAEDDEGDAAAAANQPHSPAKPTNPIEELRQTEAAYLANLLSVRANFFPKMRYCVSASEAATLFGNWAELIPCSQALSASLANPDLVVADVLAEELPRLTEAYSKYCAGIPAASALYQKKTGEKDFVDFENSFPLLNKPTFNHIMRPVQRIMKYPLLINELLKDTSMAPVDRAKLQGALSAATHLALQANSSMAQPRARVTKLDISGPDTDTFHRVSTAAAATAATVSLPAPVTVISLPRVAPLTISAFSPPAPPSRMPTTVSRSVLPPTTLRQTASDGSEGRRTALLPADARRAPPGVPFNAGAAPESTWRQSSPAGPLLVPQTPPTPPFVPKKPPILGLKPAKPPILGPKPVLRGSTSMSGLRSRQSLPTADALHEPSSLEPFAPRRVVGDNDVNGRDDPDECIYSVPAPSATAGNPSAPAPSQPQPGMRPTAALSLRPPLPLPKSSVKSTATST